MSVFVRMTRFVYIYVIKIIRTFMIAFLNKEDLMKTKEKVLKNY